MFIYLHSIKEYFRDFSGPTVRGLRVAVNSFFDKIDLIANTMEIFGPPVSKEYSHY